MSYKPNVGDVVRLNDHGLEVIFGTALGLSRMKDTTMKITAVDPVSPTAPETTYAVEVDNAEVNAYLLYCACFDLVQRAEPGV